MLQFVKEHRGKLACLPTAFLSVTLSEAGAERSDATQKSTPSSWPTCKKSSTDSLQRRDGIQRTSSQLLALCYTRTTISWIRFVMKRIAKHAGGSTDTSRDHAYTDWVALDRFVAALAEEFSSSAMETGSVPGATVRSREGHWAAGPGLGFRSVNTGHITVGPPHLIATKLLDILTNQQQIMQEVTATAKRMLEAIEALLPAAQQVRVDWVTLVHWHCSWRRWSTIPRATHRVPCYFS